MNYHYKNNGFLTPQIASVAQTIVNVMSSDFTKLLKIAMYVKHQPEAHLRTLKNKHNPKDYLWSW